MTFFSSLSHLSFRSPSNLFALEMQGVEKATLVALADWNGTQSGAQLPSWHLGVATVVGAVLTPWSRVWSLLPVWPSGRVQGRFLGPFQAGKEPGLSAPLEVTPGK